MNGIKQSLWWCCVLVVPSFVFFVLGFGFCLWCVAMGLPEAEAYKIEMLIGVVGGLICGLCCGLLLPDRDTMADDNRGRRALDQIIDAAAMYHVNHGKAPTRLNLPMQIAYDLCRASADDIGTEILTLVCQHGPAAFTHLYGMEVTLLLAANAELSVE